MATRRPKDIGTATETAVVHYLRGAGFPHAERRSLNGANDLGDITGTPGLCWEVKGGDAARRASDGQVTTWLVETEVERSNAGADIGILVLQRRGIGPTNAGRWWAIIPAWRLTGFANPSTAWAATCLNHPVRLHLSDLCASLRHVGYGTEAHR